MSAAELIAQLGLARAGVTPVGVSRGDRTVTLGRLACATGCSLTATLEAPAGKGRHSEMVRLGSATLVLGPGVARVIAVPLKPRGRGLLRASKGHLTATLDLVLRDARGDSTRAHRAIALRASK